MSLRKVVNLLTPEETRDCRWLLGLLVVASLAESLGLALVIPYIAILQNPSLLSDQAAFQWLFNGWLVQPSPSIVIAMATLLVFLAVCLKFGLQIWSNYRTANFPYKVFNRLSQELLSNYLQADFLSISKNNSNVQVKNLVSATEMSAQAILVSLQYLSHILMITALSLVMFWHSPGVTTLLIALFGTVGLAVYHLFKRKQMRAGAIKEEEQGAMHQIAFEAIQSVKEIQIYGKAKYFCDHYGVSCSRFSNALGRSYFYPLLPVVFVESLAIIVVLGAVGVASVASMTLPKLVPYLIFFGVAGRRLLPSVYQAVALRVTLQRLQASVELVQKERQLLRKSQIPQVKPPAHFAQALQFHNISFAYKPGKWAVHRINLTIPKNGSVALVGPSGAGKSTLVELLTGLLKPGEGYFLYDGLQLPSTRSLQPYIGYVPQVVQLLDGSIRDNVAFGDSRPQDENVWRALHMAQISDFVLDLEDQLDARIGERGVKLSGGQRQRIGIARALYRDPDIIVFDEATASLDSISEQMVGENIREMMGSKTIVAVAHRLSTIRHFDRIYVLHHGEIVGCGKHAELMQTCQLYATMSQRQDSAPDHSAENRHTTLAPLS